MSMSRGGHTGQMPASDDRKGQRITWGQYMKVGLILTPPVLLITLVALWMWMPVVS